MNCRLNLRLVPIPVEHGYSGIVRVMLVTWLGPVLAGGNLGRHMSEREAVVRLVSVLGRRSARCRERAADVLYVLHG